MNGFNFHDLQDFILFDVLQFLEPKSLVKFERLNKRFKNIIHSIQKNKSVLALICSKIGVLLSDMKFEVIDCNQVKINFEQPFIVPVHCIPNLIKKFCNIKSLCLFDAQELDYEVCESVGNNCIHLRHLQISSRSDFIDYEDLNEFNPLNILSLIVKNSEIQILVLDFDYKLEYGSIEEYLAFCPQTRMLFLPYNYRGNQHINSPELWTQINEIWFYGDDQEFMLNMLTTVANKIQYFGTLQVSGKYYSATQVFRTINSLFNLESLSLNLNQELSTFFKEIELKDLKKLIMTTKNIGSNRRTDQISFLDYRHANEFIALPFSCPSLEHLELNLYDLPCQFISYIISNMKSLKTLRLRFFIGWSYFQGIIRALNESQKLPKYVIVHGHFKKNGYDFEEIFFQLINLALHQQNTNFIFYFNILWRKQAKVLKNLIFKYI